MIDQITKEIITEIQKSENQEKIQVNFINPILSYILKWILPYFVIVVILFVLMIILLLVILSKIRNIIK